MMYMFPSENPIIDAFITGVLLGTLFGVLLTLIVV